MNAPVRPAWGPSFVGGRTGCPCPQCGPGPGIDFVAQRNSGRAARMRRMSFLLKEQDHRDLWPDEEAELDGLLHIYLHSSSG